MIRLLLGAPLAVLVLAVLGCAAEPTPPAAAAPTASDTPQAVATNADRRCQTDDDTGSHLRKRTVCVSDSEDAQNRNSINDAQQRQRSQTGSFSNSGGH